MDAHFGFSRRRRRLFYLFMNYCSKTSIFIFIYIYFFNLNKIMVNDENFVLYDNNHRDINNKKLVVINE